MISFIKSKLFIDYVFVFAFFLIVYLIIILLNLSKKNYFESRINEIKQSVISSFVVSIVGLTLGNLSGNSKEPIMSVLIPAILTFISGFSIYLISTKKSINKGAALMVMVFFSLFLIVGTWAGSTLKLEREKQDREWEKELIEYHVDLQIYQYKQQKVIDLEYAEYMKKLSSQ